MFNLNFKLKLLNATCNCDSTRTFACAQYRFADAQSSLADAQYLLAGAQNLDINRQILGINTNAKSALRARSLPCEC